MSDNLVLELLRVIRGDLREVIDTQKEHGRRLARIELELSFMRREMASDAEARAELQLAFDKLRDRVERIERRLELADDA